LICGFQSRVAVEASTSSGSGRPQIKRAAEHQMTLPMHSPSSETVISVADAASSPHAPPPYPVRSAPVAPGVASLVASAAPPVAEPLDVSDTEVELDGIEILRYPPVPVLATPGPVTPPVASLSAPDSRPVIRPAVPSPIATANAAGSSARRVTPSAPAALATAHLGIEESEFDKPTYLRRALAGEGLRLPSDNKL
jgi:hypothetical protein